MKPAPDILVDSDGVKPDVNQTIKRVIQVYNQQRSIHGGEEKVVLQTIDLLRNNDFTVEYFHRSSRVHRHGLRTQSSAFFSSIYSRSSRTSISQLIDSFNPDIVHAHNIYPNVSPSVFAECKKRLIPVVMTVHSQILSCPTWYHLHNGMVCEKCIGGKEYWCVLKNCRGNIAESTAYAIRNATVRTLRLISAPVTLFIAASDFMKRQLIKAGIPSYKIRLVRNMLPIPEPISDPSKNGYVAFAGRFSSEKGIQVLIAAAKALPSLNFKLAGGGPLFEEIRKEAPANVQLLGLLEPPDMAEFYRRARCVVVPSISYETFSLVAGEAMSQGVPVIASDIGAMPEILDEGAAGILVPPGDSRLLANAIEEVWFKPDLCSRLGKAGAEKVHSELSEKAHLKGLMNVYNEALLIAKGRE